MAGVLSEAMVHFLQTTLKQQALAHHMGASFQSLQRGHIEIKLPFHDLATQHHGHFHGGVVSYLADISGGIAAMSTLPDPDHSATTVELKVNFMKPATGAYLLGRGKVLSAGRSIITSTAEVYTPEGVQAAHMLQTIKVLKPK